MDSAEAAGGPVQPIGAGRDEPVFTDSDECAVAIGDAVQPGLAGKAVAQRTAIGEEQKDSNVKTEAPLTSSSLWYPGPFHGSGCCRTILADQGRRCTP